MADNILLQTWYDQTDKKKKLPPSISGKVVQFNASLQKLGLQNNKLTFRSMNNKYAFTMNTQVKDPVGMRSASVNVVGVTGDLNDVLYEEFIIVPWGGPEVLAEVLESDTAVIISEGLANVLAVPLDGKVKLVGEGIDHEQEVTVVGIAQRIPGFSGIGRMRSQAMNSSTIFMSLDGFRNLSTDPRQALPPVDDPILDRCKVLTCDGIVNRNARCICARVA